MKLKYLGILTLGLLVTAGIVLAVGCGEKVKAPEQIIKDVDAQEAFVLLEENQENADFVIIDVRTPEEFTEAHVENAINIVFGSEGFEDEIGELDRDKVYLIYCRSGNRSRGALDIMVELGFREVYHLSVGILGWIEGGYPVIE